MSVKRSVTVPEGRPVMEVRPAPLSLAGRPTADQLVDLVCREQVDHVFALEVEEDLHLLLLCFPVEADTGIPAVLLEPEGLDASPVVGNDRADAFLELPLRRIAVHAPLNLGARLTRDPDPGKWHPC